MTTLVLNDITEQTTIGEILRNAADPVIEIRSADGSLMATVTLSSAEDDDFDYGPYMSEAQRVVDEYRRRPPVDPADCLTTREFLDSLHALESRAEEHESD
jgi:hypothetical protein